MAALMLIFALLLGSTCMDLSLAHPRSSVSYDKTPSLSGSVPGRIEDGESRHKREDTEEEPSDEDENSGYSTSLREDILKNVSNIVDRLAGEASLLLGLERDTLTTLFKSQTFKEMAESIHKLYADQQAKLLFDFVNGIRTFGLALATAQPTNANNPPGADNG